MDKRRVWLSPRALRLHAVILVVVPAFLALCAWQITRALGGNSLSWAYVFEWPIFAGYAVYMWWRFVHEAADDTRRQRSPTPGQGRRRGCRPQQATTGATTGGTPGVTPGATTGGGDVGGDNRTKAYRTLRPAPKTTRTPSWPRTTSTWRSWRSGTRPRALTSVPKDSQAPPGPSRTICPHGPVRLLPVGRSLERTARILSMFGDVADQIVLAVSSRVPESKLAALDGRVDLLERCEFDPSTGIERHLAWLHGLSREGGSCVSTTAKSRVQPCSRSFPD